MSDRHPFRELFFARMREFAREPEVVFWVFGFPLLLAIGLGIAFREKPPDVIAVAIEGGPRAVEAARTLSSEAGFRAEVVDGVEAARRLRLGRVAIVVAPGEPFVYRFDPTRPESLLARARVDDALQRSAGRADPVAAKDAPTTEPGARYIDFLIPGLLGMNIMSGGMWGIGFMIVDMRSRKLLKRLVATPMRKTHFLGAMMSSRMILVFLEMILLLVFGRLVFGMIVQGSLSVIFLLSMLGAFVFAGLGLLVASRARKIETVSGLINLVMLPMFVLSGIFFSAERFPAAVQPFVKALPLTALNDSLRAVILDGASLASQLPRIAVLAVWGTASFALSLRAFRWT